MEFVYDTSIGVQMLADICAFQLRILDVTQVQFKNWPSCLNSTSKSENEMFSMNFEGICSIKLVSLPKLEPSRNVSSKVIKL